MTPAAKLDAPAGERQAAPVECFTCRGDCVLDDGAFDYPTSPWCPTCGGEGVIAEGGR